MKIWFTALSLALLFGCDEASLLSPRLTDRLNGPISLGLIGTDLAVVANANINLEQEGGSLVAIDLTTGQLLTDTFAAIPSFAGKLIIDSTRQRIYVPDRGDDGLLIYDYVIASGTDISFSPVAVSNPIPEASNGVETDEVPFEVAMLPATSRGDLLITTNNLSGSLSVIPADTLVPDDLDPDESLLEGLPLISAANFHIKDRKPGAGANKLVFHPTRNLVFITSTFSNNIYVIDTVDQQVEAMIDLSTISVAGGTHGMAIATSNRAYVAHRALDSILVMDVSHITDDGIDGDVVDFRLLNVIPVGRKPEDVFLTPDESRLFVSLSGDNQVATIDVARETVISVTDLEGLSPGQIVYDSNRNVIYVLNLLSDNISIVDVATSALQGTIP